MSKIQKILRYIRDCDMTEEEKDELMLLVIEYYYTNKNTEE